jgi:hypothetical protein
MSTRRRPRQRGGVGRVEDVRFVEVEFNAPAGTRMVVELAGGVRLLVGDRESTELAGELIEYLQRSRRKGGRR